MTGEVCLRVESLMPEKLIQRALSQGVTFGEIRRVDGHILIVWLSPKDVRRMLKLCRRFSIPARIVARRGGSALMKALYRRWTLLPGVLLGAALTLLFLSRLWIVDIAFTGSAANRGNPEDIRALLDTRGIHPGMSRAIDTEGLSADLLAGATGYSYIGARREGVRLYIEAAPEVSAPEVYVLEAAHDLYADRAGIVEAVNVEAGEPCVQPGDVVQWGQLLIRGEEQSGKEDTRGIAARGRVRLKTWAEGTATVKAGWVRTLYTGRGGVCDTLSTPWFRVPITQCAPFEDQVEMVERIPIGGLFLPVFIERRIIREVRRESSPADPAALRRRLDALAMADARLNLPAPESMGFEIGKSWIRYTTEGDALRADAVYEIYTNAARTREELLKGG